MTETPPWMVPRDPCREREREAFARFHQAWSVLAIDRDEQYLAWLAAYRALVAAHPDVVWLD